MKTRLALLLALVSMLIWGQEFAAASVWLVTGSGILTDNPVLVKSQEAGCWRSVDVRSKALLLCHYCQLHRQKMPGAQSHQIFASSGWKCRVLHPHFMSTVKPLSSLRCQERLYSDTCQVVYIPGLWFGIWDWFSKKIANISFVAKQVYKNGNDST